MFFTSMRTELPVSHARYLFRCFFCFFWGDAARNPKWEIFPQKIRQGRSIPAVLSSLLVLAFDLLPVL